MTNTCHNIFHFKEVHICVWVYEMKVFIKQKAIIMTIDSVASVSSWQWDLILTSKNRYGSNVKSGNTDNQSIRIHCEWLMPDINECLLDPP